MLSKEEIEKAYWEGYIAKQNEAMEICKQCKYIKKVKQLELREQKLIEKLEEDIREETGYAKWLDSHTKRISSAVTTMISKSQYAQEILEILKKE